MIARAHVRWRGEFNMGKPGRDNWRAFTAEQDFNPAAPGFVWNARIRFAPGISVLVRDGFVAHQGTIARHHRRLHPRPRCGAVARSRVGRPAALPRREEEFEYWRGAPAGVTYQNGELVKS
jgi:hypothetical protein